MGWNDCGDCGGHAVTREGGRAVAEHLFQVAALMLGREEDAAALVEDAVLTMDIDPCIDPLRAQALADGRLIQSAIERLSSVDPAAFRAVAFDGAPSNCVEGDDLTAAGLGSEQLALLTGGSGHALRDSLQQLPPAQRLVFVMRAVLGQDGATTAAALGWTPETVSGAYRQALCSLATSLVNTRPALA